MRPRKPGREVRAGRSGLRRSASQPRVKNKLSVVDIVGESVQLKKAGSTYKGLCPFHGEKTPFIHGDPRLGLLE